MEAAHRDVGGYFVGRPAFRLVVGVLDKVEFESGRVGETQPFLTETFMDRAVLHLVTREMLAPELQRADRN